MSKHSSSNTASRDTRQRRTSANESWTGPPLSLVFMVRRGLERWFESAGVRPSVTAEFADTALIYAFGEGERASSRHRAFWGGAPTSVWRAGGWAGESVRQHFYAISGTGG